MLFDRLQYQRLNRQLRYLLGNKTQLNFHIRFGMNDP